MKYIDKGTRKQIPACLPGEGGRAFHERYEKRKMRFLSEKIPRPLRLMRIVNILSVLLY